MMMLSAMPVMVIVNEVFGTVKKLTAVHPLSSSVVYLAISILSICCVVHCHAPFITTITFTLSHLLGMLSKTILVNIVVMFVKKKEMKEFVFTIVKPANMSLIYIA